MIEEATNTVSAAATHTATPTLDMENGEHSSNRGYVKLQRSLLDNPWLHQHPNRLSLWVHLLLLATHQKRPAEFKGRNIILAPGQLVTGRNWLARETGIPESTIEKILTDLESEHQIEQRKSTVNRLITICNWGKEQQGEQRFEQPVNNERTTNEQPMNNDRTHTRREKNDKKEKKGENEEEDATPSSSFSPEISSEDDYRDENRFLENLSDEEVKDWEDRFNGVLHPGDILADKWDWEVESPAPISTSSLGGSEGASTSGSRAAPAAAAPAALPAAKTAPPADATPLDVAKIKAIIKKLGPPDENDKEMSKTHYEVVFTRYYHRVAAHFGHKMKTTVEADAFRVKKICEGLSRLSTPIYPDVVKVWIVWYFLYLPPHTNHTTGLYPTVFAESFDKFYWRAKDAGVLAPSFDLTMPQGQ